MADANRNGVDDSLETNVAASQMTPGRQQGGQLDLYQQAQQAAGAVQQTPSGPGSTNNPWVYMGPGYTRQAPLPADFYSGYADGFDPNVPQVGTFATDKLTMEEALQQFWKFSDTDKARFDNFLARSGAKPGEMTTLKKYDIWKTYIEASLNYAMAGKTNISPWDVMNAEISAREAEQAKEPKTVTQTSRSVDLSSRADVEAILYQASKTLLGRAPTDDEVASFLTGVNAMERESPTLVTTRTTTSPEGEVVDQQVERSGGVSDTARSLAAKKEAEKSPEYGAYQAATTYYNDFMELLRSA